MRQQRLVTGLTVAFALMTAILLGASIALSPALLVLTAVFAGVTALLYYHASGRLLARLYRGVERRAATDGSTAGRGGFGAGPREEWTPPRQEQRQRRQQSRRQRVRDARQRQTRGTVQQSRQTVREAAQVLGVAPNADEGTVRQAYRKRIKEVHPDADGGDEAEFKRVQEAYEVLTET